MRTEAEDIQFNDILRAYYVRRASPSFLQAYRYAARMAKEQGIRVPSPQGARRQYLALSTDADVAVRAGRVQREAGL
jgi:hypothetical protein